MGDFFLIDPDQVPKLVQTRTPTWLSLYLVCRWFVSLWSVATLPCKSGRIFSPPLCPVLLALLISPGEWVSSGCRVKSSSWVAAPRHIQAYPQGEPAAAPQPLSHLSGHFPAADTGTESGLLKFLTSVSGGYEILLRGPISTQTFPKIPIFNFCSIFPNKGVTSLMPWGKLGMCSSLSTQAIALTYSSMSMHPHMCQHMPRPFHMPKYDQVLTHAHIFLFPW